MLRLLLALVLLLSGCGAFERLGEAEAVEGRGAHAVQRILEDPSLGTALSAGAEYLVWALTVMFGGGGAALVLRNKRSNRRKARIEEHVAELEAELEELSGKLERCEVSLSRPSGEKP